MTADEILEHTTKHPLPDPITALRRTCDIAERTASNEMYDRNDHAAYEIARSVVDNLYTLKTLRAGRLSADVQNRIDRIIDRITGV